MVMLLVISRVGDYKNYKCILRGQYTKETECKEKKSCIFVIRGDISVVTLLLPNNNKK